MKRSATYGLIGLSGLAALATIDQALGLGGGALLADICRTILDESPADMAGMDMEVKPAPLIGLSLVLTLAAIFVMTREQKKAAVGLSALNEAEKATVLRAIIAVGASHRTVSREDIQSVYFAVTGEMLDEALADFAHAESRVFDSVDSDRLCVADCTDPLLRRRVLAAALMLGCVVRQPNEATHSIIDRFAEEMGADDADFAAASAALEDWSKDAPVVPGVSLASLLRGRRLRFPAARLQSG